MQLENYYQTQPSIKKLSFPEVLRIRPSVCKDSVMSDTGLLNSSTKMVVKSLLLLNITQPSTHQRDSTQMMSVNGSVKKEPLKDIQVLKRPTLLTQEHSWKRNVMF